MRILIIEDEIKTAKFLQKGLQEEGFIAEVANDGQEGLFMATSENFDLIILDVMLPKLNGWQVMEKLHETGQDIPVLFLTARDSVEDKVKGLQLGADDYLVKPFAFSELLARVQTLLRRTQTRQPEKLQVADLEIDPTRHRAYRAGQRLDLTPKEFSLLALFIRRQGQLLSRTLIAEQVWDMNFDSDTNVVDVAVRRLRQKMDDPFPKKLIHTVRGVGYVMEER